MKNVTSEEINEFLKLYQDSGSLREVSRLTGRSVNTIKKYLIGKIPIKLCPRVSKVNSTDNLLVGVYVGLWMGDGTQYYDNSYVVKFCSNKQQNDLNKFIQDIVFRLFNKQSWLIEDKNTNRAYIKLKSKFIYDFIYSYSSFGTNKTLSVGLKNNINQYSDKFLEGVTDGTWW